MTDKTQAGASGYRGYISSRPVNGVPYPHKVQNLVIRDYAARKGLALYLSATEVAVPGSYMMLNDVLAQLAEIKGIILFSQFLLPAQRNARHAIYAKVLKAGCELHGALEEAVLSSESEIAVFDAVLALTPHLARAPYGGRFASAGNVSQRECLLREMLGRESSAH